MRFDDRLGTVLAQPAADAAALAAKWRQLVDLLAQRDGSDTGPEVERALAFLHERRELIAPELRERIARSLPRILNPQIEPLFWGEEPQAVEKKPPSPSPEQAKATPAARNGEAHIRELIERIDALRKRRDSERVVEPPKAEAFRWECGAEGLILWADGVPRGPVVGQTIASAATPGGFGVDAQAAGAFARRAPFRDVRFTVAGEGAAAGDWRLSGVPFFDPQLGHFLGYRGSARRPRLDEVAAAPRAEPAADGLFGTQLQPDSLRQLIHELRTPLNAIQGFAEMIDGQFLGPAAASYRARAARIREQAGTLMSAVDDLDTAARIETSRFPVEQSSVDAVALLYRLQQDYERLAHQRHASMRLEFARDLPLAQVEPDAAERIFARMLAATIGLAREGETLPASIAMGDSAGRPMLCVSISRPQSISGLREAQLLDPGYTPEGNWPAAPALGLGFALRLVRNLAQAVGGSLVVEEDRFLLFLPPVKTEGGASLQSA